MAQVPLPSDPSALLSFGRLELVARQLVEGLMMGRHRSPFKGSSVEFVEHREYYPGDDMRHIDWRAYGKTGHYYIKEFEDETNLRAYLMLDASGSMAYEGKSARKYDYARLLTGALTWLLLSQRDSVGLFTFDNQIRGQLKPSSSRDTYRRIIQVLEETTPGEDTGLASVADEILPTLRRRSMVILISDCFDTVERLDSVLQRLRHARHEIVVFRIAAPEEIEFPFDRPTQFRNLEVADHRLLVDPARLRKEYLRQYHEFSEELEKVCGDLAVDYRVVLTSDPVQDVLGTWLAERMAMSGPRR